jgi:serine---pyruvate transaminase
MKSHPLFEKLRIFAPGPTPVPESVLSLLAHSPLHHRTKEFISILARTKENLSFLFQTRQPSYLFNSSGTGAMEAAIVNLFSPGDEVTVINGGKFGERWGQLAERYDLRVHQMKVEWGYAAKPEELAKHLKAHPKTQGVLFQGSETSTAVYHPVEQLAKVTHENSDALVIVDAITTLGVSSLPMDEWGLDVVVSGSQKALMLPPGLAFLAMSERAAEQRKKATLKSLKRFYFDLDSEDEAAVEGETPWTPAVSLVVALDGVLQKFKSVGLEPVFRHHTRLAGAMRAGVQGMGLELFAKESPSTALTAVHAPKGVEGKQIISHLRDRYSITVAGGQDQWKGKIFRLAHLGYYDDLDVLTILSAVELTLKTLGVNCELGRGVGAAETFFVKSE